MSSNSDPPTVPTRRDISKTLSATKNLRAISKSLVKKLRSSNGISSVEIASELASEAIKEVEGGSFVAAVDELQAVGKNIRRRLYDSLKVLESVGAIHRAKKDKTLTWVGTNHLVPQSFRPNSSDSKAPCPDATALSRSVGEIRKSIADKHAELSHLETQFRAMVRLCRRNRRFPDPQPARIELPFVVIRTPVTTEIRLEATPDARSMTFDFHGHYEIVNDTSILDRMFLVTDSKAVINQSPRVDCDDAYRVCAPSPSDGAIQRQPGVDPFLSPKRRRVSSKSPFAKYTSGSKPPLSPGTPLRHDAMTHKRRDSSYASPLQQSPRIHRTSTSTETWTSPHGSSPRTNMSAPPRKRKYDVKRVNEESPATIAKRGFLRRTYGPSPEEPNMERVSGECENIEKHASRELARMWKNRS